MEAKYSFIIYCIVFIGLILISLHIKVCPNCGSASLSKKKDKETGITKYFCNNCGHFFW